ncbi:Flagellar L-ring protein [Candidatus Magnetomoraceae bacterium gMMP-15]
MKSFIKIISLMAVAITMFYGCVTTSNKTPSKFPPTVKKLMDQRPVMEIYEPPEAEEGSLWNETSNNLFVDLRARKVGDLITIRISETPEAELNAKTTTARDSGISASLDFLGYMKALERKNTTKDPLTGAAMLGFDRSKMFSSSFQPSFTGEGTNNRNGSMTAYITGTVLKVLPNGNLLISGKRAIKVNNETQYITISGIIRPEDIDPNNEVQSTYIAEARIEYSGKGVISNQQKPGWLMRIMDHVWPF